MRRAFALCLVLVFARSAFAKDDTPNAHQLAVDHPWHPLDASITDIEVTCGKDRHHYELDVDSRGWVYLIGPTFEALSMPDGRWLKTSKTWVAADERAWLAPRAGELLSVRHLIGTPILPESWVPKKVSRADGNVIVELADRTLVFDVSRELWISDKDFVVREDKRFGKQLLPSLVALTGGCTMRRTSRTSGTSGPSRTATPKMPELQDLHLPSK